MDKEHITIPEQKLQMLTSHVWAAVEKPILATTIEFKNDTNAFQPGIIMVTYGAIYIFKAKVFGAPEFLQELHLLNCLELSVREDSTIEMLFNGYFFVIRAKDYIEIADVLLSVWSECTFGVKNFKLMSVNCEVDMPNYECKERPNNALKHRALFLAHYYNIKGEQLHAVDYFTKYEDKPSSMLVLGPHFHPGNFASAFGHAIGWESELTTITFQSFTASKFNKLFNTLIQNAQKINRIAFTDYKESRLPTFEIAESKNNAKTNIRRYWFIRTCGRIIYDFMMNSENLPGSMDDLVIASCTLRPQEFGDIVTSISESKSASNLKYICLIRVTMKPFPYDDFTRLLSITSHLQSITVRSLDIDASHLLKAVCMSNTRLRALGLTRVQFRTDIPPGLELPPTLRMLNISYSAFSSSSFKSLIEFLTLKPVKTPFILQAQQLVLKQIAYQALSELEFDKLQPNLCEIDWSGNHIPKEPMRYFFAFLFTQTRSHLLMMNEVTCGDSTLFLSYLAQLARSVPLTGLDVSGKFPSAVFSQFISSLEYVPELRRLQLSCRNAGDVGLEAFAELIPKLPYLTEVLADGFRPRTPQPFFALWRVISNHQSIISCDVPNEDLFALGLSLLRLGPDISQIFQIIQKKNRPTTVEKRLQYLISKAESEEDEYEYEEEEEEKGNEQQTTTTTIGKGVEVFNVNEYSDSEEESEKPRRRFCFTNSLLTMSAANIPVPPVETYEVEDYSNDEEEDDGHKEPTNKECDNENDEIPNVEPDAAEGQEQKKFPVMSNEKEESYSESEPEEVEQKEEEATPQENKQEEEKHEAAHEEGEQEENKPEEEEKHEKVPEELQQQEENKPEEEKQEVIHEEEEQRDNKPEEEEKHEEVHEEQQQKSEEEEKRETVQKEEEQQEENKSEEEKHEEVHEEEPQQQQEENKEEEKHEEVQKEGEQKQESNGESPRKEEEEETQEKLQQKTPEEEESSSYEAVEESVTFAPVSSEQPSTQEEPTKENSSDEIVEEEITAQSNKVQASAQEEPEETHENETTTQQPSTESPPQPEKPSKRRRRKRKIQKPQVLLGPDIKIFEEAALMKWDDDSTNYDHLDRGIEKTPLPADDDDDV